VYLSSSNSDEDDEVPLAKRAKFLFERTESANESNPSTAEPTPPPRTVVAKVPVSKVNPYAGASAPPVAPDHVSITFSTISFLISELMLDFWIKY
jgi:hypothetical protein